MPRVSCRVCSSIFYVKPNRLERGWGKYCSKECRSLGFRRGKYVACDQCGKEIYKTLKEQRGSKSGRLFCGKSCQTKWRNSVYRGSNHTNWKGGESAYRDILLRASVERLCRKCGTTDERILAVHHKDKNRKNNNLENLIWLCHNCHFLVHHYKHEAVGFLVATNRGSIIPVLRV